MIQHGNVRLITPQMAEAWLNNSIGNLRHIKRRIENYARDMKNGAWKFNGQSIVLSKEGRLLDGHHRLGACVLAGVPFRSLVVEGVEEDAYSTIDTGAARTFGQVLGHQGVKEPNTFAAALGHIWRYESGMYSKGETTISPTRNDMEQAAARHPDLSASVSTARRCKLARGAALSVVHCLAAEVDLTEADLFVDQLIDEAAYTSSFGVTLSKDDPVHRLREYFIAANAGARTHQARQFVVLALIIKAYNFAQEGRMIKQLKWRTGEPFPILLPGHIKRAEMNGNHLISREAVEF